MPKKSCALDNACNLAFALAGRNDQLKVDHIKGHFDLRLAARLEKGAAALKSSTPLSTPESVSLRTSEPSSACTSQERKPLPGSYPTPASPSPLPSTVTMAAGPSSSTPSGRLHGAYPLMPRSLSPTPSASNREPQNEEDSKAQESKGADQLHLYRPFYPKLDMSSDLTDTEASFTKSSPNIIETPERISAGESNSSEKADSLARRLKFERLKL